MFAFFLSLFSLCGSDWVISIVLPYSSLILSSVTFILLLGPSADPFILVIMFFSSKMSIWLFCISSISVLRPSVFFDEAVHFLMFQVCSYLLIETVSSWLLRCSLMCQLIGPRDVQIAG